MMHLERPFSSRPFVLNDVRASLVTGLLCFLLAFGTLHLTSDGKSIATVWPSNAVILAMLMLRPKASWWPIVTVGTLGHIVAALFTRPGWEGSVMFAVANDMEVLLAAWAIRKTSNSGGLAGSWQNIACFALWAGVIAPLVSGIFGAGTAWLLFDLPYDKSYAIWYLSDSLGLLIFTPFLFALFGGDYVAFFRARTRVQGIEMVALLLLTGLVAQFVFGGTRPLLFLVMVPTLLVAFRLGWPGVKLAILIVAVIGALNTAHDIGPMMLMSDNPVGRSHFFQIFILTLLLTNWPVATSLDTRHMLMEKLQDSEQSLRILASQSSVLLLTFDVAGVCRKAVGASDLLLGRAAERLPGSDLRDLSEDPAVKSAHDVAMDKAPRLHSVEFHACDNDTQWLEATFRSLDDENGRCLGTLATIHDVTVRKRQTLALARTAETDSLTGLLNRAGFFNRLQLALNGAQSGSLSLAVIDVDRFKLINDNCGHQIGDVVLTEIATRIAAQLRASDVVARLGGDEFVILLPTMDWQKAQDVCARVVDAVCIEPIQLPSSGTLNAAISCGLSRYRTGLTAEQFLHDADIALYEAKRGGRNRVVAA